MAKKKNKKIETLSIERANKQQAEMTRDLTQPEYSLEPDPTGKLKLTEDEKNFVRHYCNYKSLPVVQTMTGMSEDECLTIFRSWKIQDEIRRINRALYLRQFANRLVTIDDLGGYLSSLLTDEFVPAADRLPTREKLRVVDLLIRVNQLKQDSVQNPGILLYRSLETEFKDLSVAAITRLLSNVPNMTEKQEAINELEKQNGQRYTEEEVIYLKSLDAGQLTALLNKMSEGGENK